MPVQYHDLELDDMIELYKDNFKKKLLCVDKKRY